MDIRRTDDVDELINSYMLLGIGSLDELLKKHGIDDRETRFDICHRFFQDHAERLHGRWFQHEGERIRAVLAFSPVETGGVVKELRLPRDLNGTMYGEQAHIAIGRFFTEKNEKHDVQSG